MSYEQQKEYFERAYRTGSDIWTHTPYTLKGKDVLEYLPASSMILDLGSGRGRFPFELVKLGIKVIGLDYISEIVKNNNEEIKMLDLSEKIRFVEGDVLAIPFTDESFDGVLDFGVLQHIKKDDWQTYTDEIERVLKPGGYYLSVLLSRETDHFLSWIPKQSEDGDFEHEGVYYHFFTKEEICTLFDSMTLVQQKIEYIQERDNLAYVVSVFKK